MKEPEWMALASEEVGEREVRGRRDNPRIMQFYADVGQGGIKHDEVPWCAAFVGACLERAGIRSTRSLMARSYLKWGVQLDEPRRGAITVLRRGRNPTYGHVGFLVKATRKSLYLLGGNQSDSVKISRYSRSRLLGFRWPDQLAGELELGTPLVGNVDADDEREWRDEIDLSGDDVFEAGLAHVLKMEGGYSDDPHDPGGATNFGITIGTYARVKGIALTAQNIGSVKAKLKRIPQSLVRRIYRERYWDRARCSRLPPALALMQFDCAVNQGVGRAAKLLQKSVGANVDGEIGPLTLAAARNAPIEQALERYAELRRSHYRGLPHFWRFGRGWLRRVDKTLDLTAKFIGLAETHKCECIGADANARTGESKILSNDAIGSNEERQDMAKDAGLKDVNGSGASKWWGESMTIWGAILTAVSSVLPALGPLIGLDITADLVKQLGEQLITLVNVTGGVVGIIMTVYGRSRATSRLTRREITLTM